MEHTLVTTLNIQISNQIRVYIAFTFGEANKIDVVNFCVCNISLNALI